MNKKERKYLESVWKDCVALKKKGELTEFGEGQMTLARLLLYKKS